MIGPVIGGILDEAFGWQANFGLLLGLGLIVLALCWADLGETATLQRLSFKDQLRSYPGLLKSRRFWGYCGAAAFSSGCFYAYLGGAPYVGTEVYHLSSSRIGLLFAITAVGYMAGNFFAGRYSMRLGMNKMVLIGTTITTLGLIALAVHHRRWPLQCRDVLRPDHHHGAWQWCGAALGKRRHPVGAPRACRHRIRALAARSWSAAVLPSPPWPVPFCPPAPPKCR